MVFIGIGLLCPEPNQRKTLIHRRRQKVFFYKITTYFDEKKKNK